jgi:hypothetical protein
MKSGFVFVIIKAVALAHFASAKLPLLSAKGNLKYVDPLIGTDSNYTQSEYGGMIPSTGKTKEGYSLLCLSYDLHVNQPLLLR